MSYLTNEQCLWLAQESLRPSPHPFTELYCHIERQGAVKKEELDTAVLSYLDRQLVEINHSRAIIEVTYTKQGVLEARYPLRPDLCKFDVKEKNKKGNLKAFVDDVLPSWLAADYFVRNLRICYHSYPNFPQLIIKNSDNTDGSLEHMVDIETSAGTLLSNIIEIRNYCQRENITLSEE